MTDFDINENYTLTNTKVCDKCGKSFEVWDPKTWVYSIFYHKKRRYFCTYTCYNTFLKEIESKKKKKKDKKSNG